MDETEIEKKQLLSKYENAILRYHTKNKLIICKYAECSQLFSIIMCQCIDNFFNL